MTSAKLTTMCKLSEFFTYRVIGKYGRRIGKEIFCVCQQNLDFDVNKTVRQNFLQISFQKWYLLNGKTCIGDL